MAVTYTKAQKDRAKADGLHLATISVSGVEFQGPVTEDDRIHLLKILTDYLSRRSAKLKEDNANEGVKACE
ncbi:hypothetical protein [Fimbriiglobus ruber]|uniref:hypothetical protein n=1 Tax=Fimbriiglobus ruber TaxID=1908690 RepID=UPI000B4A731F|nr:hypothetical protein [Fimbriiglobus ruber]